MHAVKLLSIAVIAATLVLLQSSAHAASVSQIEQLKQQFLPAEYRNTNFTVDEVKKIFREKCKKATGIVNSTLYTEIEKGAAQLVACFSNFTNVTMIQDEIEKARPLGDLDMVFHKYCTKVPQIQTCIDNFNELIQPCLTRDERKQNAVMMRVASGLMGFMCAKGGDQMALFVAEDGPECLEANKDAIGQCMNNSFAEYIPKDGKLPNLYDLPELVLAPKHCVDLERFEKCTLHHLEQCQEITPANVAEAVFRFVKNETRCKSWIEEKANERSVLKDTRNAAASFSSAFRYTLLVCVLLTMWRRFCL